VKIRLADGQDAAEVRAIYAPVVESTAISFETTVPTVEAIASRILDRQPRYPWLVAEDDSVVVGYAYAGRFASRAAYDWSVETSVYIDERARGRRVGTALYAALLEILTAQGYRQVMAGISLPNPASVALHESMGFVSVGRFSNAGWKLGQWHDVGWWEQRLGRALDPPEPVRSLDELPVELMTAAFAAGASTLTQVMPAEARGDEDRRPRGREEGAVGQQTDEPPWEVYDSMAPSYADHAADSPYNAHYDRPSMLELCGDVVGLRVLDAACGPGFYAAELVERGARVVAFDASAEMVELTRRRLGDAVEVRQAVLGEPLPYPDDSFDVALCALAIHYVADRAAAFGELFRVLRPGGAAVISTQHPTADWLRKGASYFDVALETDVWQRDGKTWDVRYWREPLSSLADAVQRAGFLIEQVAEPLPAESMRARWPDDFDKLSQQPGFLNLRLRKLSH
jgi:L-amino acid N-acyltransferase YncA/ubiquinone/menaquinone biosynthesis C-methylase UbiE